MSAHIVKLVSADRMEVSEGVDILRVLSDYYETLYASKFSGTGDVLAAYLDTVILLALSAQSKQSLEQPTSCSELEEALQSAPH